MDISPTRNALTIGKPGNRETVLGRLGNLVVRIAETNEEVEAALRLRHDVFGRTLPTAAKATERDEDRYDAHCDHLIVEDLSSGDNAPQIVATYRLLGPEAASRVGGYYSENEFSISKLTARHPELRFLEFGRSCVLAQYRSKRTIELLWHGSWAYVRKHGYDVMFGCASFAGTDVTQHAEALAFLAANAGPGKDWRTTGIGDAIPMQAENYDPSQMKSALKSLPPLIKGYLRLGAMFADEAVVDHDFGTIDVLVLLPISRLNPRYVKYYGEDAARHAC